MCRKGLNITLTVRTVHLLCTQRLDFKLVILSFLEEITRFARQLSEKKKKKRSFWCQRACMLAAAGLPSSFVNMESDGVSFIFTYCSSSQITNIELLFFNPPQVLMVKGNSCRQGNGVWCLWALHWVTTSVSISFPLVLSASSINRIPFLFPQTFTENSIFTWGSLRGK